MYLLQEHTFINIYRERYRRIHARLKMVNTIGKGAEIGVVAKRIFTFSVIF